MSRRENPQCSHAEAFPVNGQPSRTGKTQLPALAPCWPYFLISSLALCLAGCFSEIFHGLKPGSTSLLAECETQRWPGTCQPWGLASRQDRLRLRRERKD